MGPKKKQESEISLMVAHYLKSNGFDQSYASFLTESKSAITDVQVSQGDAINIQEVYSFWKASNESVGNGTKRKAEVPEGPSVPPPRASKRTKGKAGVVDPEVVNGDETAVTNEKGKTKKKGKETRKKAVTEDVVEKPKDDQDEVEDKSLEEKSLAVGVEAIEVVKGKKGKEKAKGKKGKEPVEEGDDVEGKKKSANEGPLAPAVDNAVTETETETEKPKVVKGGRKAKAPAKVKQSEAVTVEDGEGEGLEEGAEQADAEPVKQEIEGGKTKKKRSKKVDAVVEKTLTVEDAPLSKSNEEATIAPVAEPVKQEIEGEKAKKKRSKKVDAVVEKTLTVEDAPLSKSSEEATIAPVVEARKSKRTKKEVNVEPLEDDVPVKSSEEVILVKSTEEDIPVEASEIATVSPANGGKSSEGKGTAARAFQRVRVEEVAFLDERLKDNSYWAKNGADSGWGAKAQEVLGQVRGKGFRHEKTKKKRGSYKGGPIDMESHSIKFQNSDDDE